MKDIMEEFVEYAKKQFGYDISYEESLCPDTFESFFGASFLEQKEDEIIFCEGNETYMSYCNNVTKLSLNLQNQYFYLKSKLFFAA